MIFKFIRETKYFTNNKDFYNLYIDLLKSQSEDLDVLFLVEGDTIYVGDLETKDSLILQLGSHSPDSVELTLANFREDSSLLEKELFELLEYFEAIYPKEIDIYLTNGEILKFKGVDLVEEGDELVFNVPDGTKKVFLLDNIAGYSIGES